MIVSQLVYGQRKPLTSSTQAVEHQAVIDAANSMLDARRAVHSLGTDDQAALRSLVA